MDDEDITRDELGDGQPDHVGRGRDVGDDAVDLFKSQATGFLAEAEHDFVAVDGSTRVTLFQPRHGFSDEQIELTIAGYNSFFDTMETVI